VDIRQKSRIGKFSKIVNKPGVDIHIYDHHPPSRDDIHGSMEVVKEVGATTTILCQVLKKQKIKISADEATIMMLGLYEDTGNLTFSSTRKDDFLAAAYLLSKGADLNLISDILTKDFTAEQISLLNELVESATIYSVNGIDVVLTKVFSNTYISDFAVLVHRLRDMENVDVLCALARMEDRVYLVARSRRKEVDVGEIAKAFGGGGHSSAASATVKDLTLFQVEEKLKNILHDKISPPRLARDFMSYPVKTIDADETLSKAGRFLTRYNINVLPVIKKDRLVGLISRQVIEKASHHGLKDLPVEEYMIREFSVVGPETPWSTIQKNIIEHNQRFLPVTKGKKLVGGITRTDLLRVLHTDLTKEPYQPPRQSSPTSPRQKRFLTHHIGEQLPKKVVRMLKDLGAVAEEMKVNAYVVGGFVRDIFLHRENLDIDLVIEGNGIEFAKKVASRHDSHVKTHRTFGTAVITFPDGFKVDVASARLEYYEYPAALPQVGFRIGKLTLSLIENAVKLNFLERLEGRRFLSELILMLQEDEVIPNIKRMNQLNILQFLHPRITFDSSARGLLERINEVINWYELSFLEERYERWRVYFLGLIDGLQKKEVLSLCTRLSMNGKEEKKMVQLREHARKVLLKMAKNKNMSNSQMFHLLHPLSPECLLDLMARVTKKEAKKVVSNYLTQLKHTKIKTTGKDLKKLGLPPGKLYKKILDKLLDAKLDGKVSSKREETAFVKEKFLA
jgi:nanoRNase/pAp phosphatase (c-di-AMP/oligoRNAs hydrolase)/tRNA nucleotidyltransferase/poly(A) polymerase